MLSPGTGESSTPRIGFPFGAGAAPGSGGSNGSTGVTGVAVAVGGLGSGVHGFAASFAPATGLLGGGLPELLAGTSAAGVVSPFWEAFLAAPLAGTNRIWYGFGGSPTGACVLWVGVSTAVPGAG